VTNRGLRVRPPAVAGTFYPAGPDTLSRAIRDCFAAARAGGGDGVRRSPKALVVPHAGYIYSGPVAASAYLRLMAARDTVTRIVLLGPAHRVAVHGLAVSSADAFATPLGLVTVDAGARERVLTLPAVAVNDDAHALEHSLEVQLPFLQTVLGDVAVLPLVVGTCATSDMTAVLDLVWGGDDTVVIVSTDLSHYHRYADAVVLDQRTVAAIVALRAEEIGDRDACGAYPLRGLLAAASTRHMTAELLDARNSGDTAGDRERVVGYGAVALA
jgi:AmmeMemoRadiSam system protein B